MYNELIGLIPNNIGQRKSNINNNNNGMNMDEKGRSVDRGPACSSPLEMRSSEIYQTHTRSAQQNNKSHAPLQHIKDFPEMETNNNNGNSNFYFDRQNVQDCENSGSRYIPLTNNETNHANFSDTVRLQIARGSSVELLRTGRQSMCGINEQNSKSFSNFYWNEPQNDVINSNNYQNKIYENNMREASHSSNNSHTTVNPKPFICSNRSSSIPQSKWGAINQEKSIYNQTTGFGQEKYNQETSIYNQTAGFGQEKYNQESSACNQTKVAFLQQMSKIVNLYDIVDCAWSLPIAGNMGPDFREMYIEPFVPVETEEGVDTLNNEPSEKLSLSSSCKQTDQKNSRKKTTSDQEYWKGVTAQQVQLQEKNTQVTLKRLLLSLATSTHLVDVYNQMMEAQDMSLNRRVAAGSLITESYLEQCEKNKPLFSLEAASNNSRRLNEFVGYTHNVCEELESYQILAQLAAQEKLLTDKYDTLAANHANAKLTLAKMQEKLGEDKELLASLEKLCQAQGLERTLLLSICERKCRRSTDIFTLQFRFKMTKSQAYSRASTASPHGRSYAPHVGVKRLSAEMVERNQMLVKQRKVIAFNPSPNKFRHRKFYPGENTKVLKDTSIAATCLGRVKYTHDVIRNVLIVNVLPEKREELLREDLYRYRTEHVRSMEENRHVCALRAKYNPHLPHRSLINPPSKPPPRRRNLARFDAWENPALPDTTSLEYN